MKNKKNNMIKGIDLICSKKNIMINWKFDQKKNERRYNRLYISIIVVIMMKARRIDHTRIDYSSNNDEGKEN